MGRRRFGRHTVDTSREEKTLFPEADLTKGDLIDYFTRVFGSMKPHLADRPLSLRRYPDGIRSEGFFQKQVPDYFPSWIRSTRVRKEGGHQDLVIADRQATLAYLANQACITLHGWLSRADRPDHPDQLVIDLDPAGRDFGAVRQAALRCRTLFEELAVPSFVKSSGSRGLHVTVPLDRRATFDEARSFAQRFAGVLAARFPKELTTEQRKQKRAGRIYLDVGRNAYGQTVVVPYSTRARPGAPVAVPLRWDEVASRRLSPRRYTVRNLFRRLAQIEDPWQGFARSRILIRAAQRRLERLEDST
ncbi:MAG: ATP-dependent DNA ligase [Candidatus Eisenbacteria bacterium]|nr:ATP-dependent DNA ligase [Candidatus Eisenbacteria bacterium]